MPTFPQKGREDHSAEEAARKAEELKKKAQEINDEILRDYDAMNTDKIAVINLWYSEEKRKIDQSKAQNTAYDEALVQLNAVKVDKMRKANLEMLDNSTKIWLEAQKNARDLHDQTSTAGLEGPQKDLLDMQNRYNDALADTEAKYKNLNIEFQRMDKESQTQYLEANPDMSRNSDGSLDYSKRLAQEKLVIDKNYYLEKQNYHTDEKQWEYDFNRIMQSKSIDQLDAFLKTEAAMEAQQWDGQTAAMQEYYGLWKKTHKTTMEEMAEAAQTFNQSLQSLFQSITDGAKSSRDAFRSFLKSLADVGLKGEFEKISAGITQSIFGPALGKTNLDTNNPELLQKAAGLLPSLLSSNKTSLGSGVWSSSTLGSGLVDGMTDSSAWQTLSDTLLSSKLPGFADGGIASGWSIVGERGPELINFMNPGRVYSNADTLKMLTSTINNSRSTTNHISVPISLGDTPSPTLSGRLRNEVGSLVQRIVYEETRR
jgi:hypothetical protein